MSKAGAAVSASDEDAPPSVPDAQAPWAVPGQDRAARVLAAAATGGLGHAWALIGVPGVGQEQLAGALTMALTCQEGRPGEACGRCDDCDRAARGRHPARQTFEPTAPTYRVEEVRRQWLAAASLTADGWKLLHVRQADRLNDAAANAFLRALEEPAEGTVWLLEVADPDELPDTILSRCRQLPLAPLPRPLLEEQATALGYEDPTERALAVHAARGSAARLRALTARDLEALRARQRLLGELRADQGRALTATKELLDAGEAAAAQARRRSEDELDQLRLAHGDPPPDALVKEVEERAKRATREQRLAALQSALDDLLAWVRDVLAVREGAPDAALLAPYAREGLEADAAALSRADLRWAADRIQRTREDLERNVVPRLALEALLLELAALARRG